MYDDNHVNHLIIWFVGKNTRYDHQLYFIVARVAKIGREKCNILTHECALRRNQNFNYSNKRAHYLAKFVVNTFWGETMAHTLETAPIYRSPWKMWVWISEFILQNPDLVTILMELRLGFWLKKVISTIWIESVSSLSRVSTHLRQRERQVILTAYAHIVEDWNNLVHISYDG